MSSAAEVVDRVRMEGWQVYEQPPGGLTNEQMLMIGGGVAAVAVVAVLAAVLLSTPPPPPPPSTLSVSANGTPTSGAAPLAVDFTASASGGTPPYTYLWAFGDGVTSTEQNPVHPYSSPGTYTALVTVTDAAGQAAQSSVSVSVSSGPPPPPPPTTQLAITFDKSTYNQGDMASFAITGATPNGSVQIDWTGGSGVNVHTTLPADQNGIYKGSEPLLPSTIGTDYISVKDLATGKTASTTITVNPTGTPPPPSSSGVTITATSSKYDEQYWAIFDKDPGSYLGGNKWANATPVQEEVHVAGDTMSVNLSPGSYWFAITGGEYYSGSITTDKGNFPFSSIHYGQTVPFSV